MPKLNENTAAVNAVMMAPSTASMPATDTTCASTATTASSTNEPATYSHNEVQQLLEDTRHNGWQEGVEKGLKIGKRKELENTKRRYKEGKDN